MSDDIAWMVEAERRGLLGADDQAWLSEARRRGLVPGQQQVQESWGDYFKGVGRSAAQGVGFGFGDEAIAAARSLGGESYDSALEGERQALDQFRERHPIVAYGTEIASGAALPMGAAGNALRGGLTLGKVAKGAATVGAPTGAAYGLGTAEGLDPRRQSAEEFTAQAAQEAAKGAVSGAAGYAVGAPVGAAIARGMRPQSDAGAVGKLLSEGIPLTPGQISGGIGRRLEDASMSIPFVGQVVRNAQRDAIEGFNEAAINRALAPIGEKLPKDLRFGHDAVDYAATKLSEAYENIVPSLSGQIDQQLSSDLAALGKRATDLPDDEMGKKFLKIVEVQIANRAKDGTFTGVDLKKAESELGRISSNYLKDQSADIRDLGALVAETQYAVRNMVARHNPEAAPVLQKINDGWANYVRVRAAASNSSSAGGVFNPTQFNVAMRGADKSVGKDAVARGHARLQDLADAAKQVLPQRVADSGTPERSAVMAGLGGGLAYLNPAALIGAGALAAAYTRPGQAVIRALMTQRPRSATTLASAIRGRSGGTAARSASVQHDRHKRSPVVDVLVSRR